jgi:peptide/nickel transport system ATP-binding protein
MTDTILEVKKLKKYYKTPGGLLHAVDDVNFTLERGKTLGVVGESGCGKTTLGRCILRLEEPTAGQIFFEGEDIASYSEKRMRVMRQKIQMIFQDPFSSLDPRMSVFELIGEPIKRNHLLRTKKDLGKRVKDLMDLVGMSSRFINSYPHEMDGGRRQRVGIARALALNPVFIVCDEPVSALDVSIQAQILNLLKSLQKELSLSYIFITHNLSVVNYFADDIVVMYLGRLVEKASSEDLFNHTMHPYAKALLSAVPLPELGAKRERILLRGEIASPIDPPAACRFAPRCLYTCERCAMEEPSLHEIGKDHFVACSEAERLGVWSLS